ncbi:MAG: hypothetical protein DRR16_13710 [Candidatus Parabeggiatoa sp. nov. 3]|nr:MAG: hypothetical protein DRR00_00030 [Gammaproteobacteria bacterium]RKZ65265.1 MAG: hypothetical protein DRQ99_13165 [Gammaproteobacteria bacterium]RKZ84794.1 MAG: hypothetical protein DRR16_13710 [Gammaproteobacteria bacterium]
MKFKSTGIFRYSPPLNRHGTLIRRDGQTTKWWLIIECDPELGRYLRYQFKIKTYQTQSVQAPLWGTHISVIRNEEPPLKTNWEKLQAQEIEFEYDSTIQETEGYLWVAVQCEAALKHRAELGLSPEPELPLHLTLGNLKKAHLPLPTISNN